MIYYEKGIFMRKTKIAILLIFLFHTLTSYAVSAANSIECTPIVNGNSVQMTGRVSGTEDNRYVTILVGNVENNAEVSKIMYLNQTTTDENGNFSFNFKMPERAESGAYKFSVGSNAEGHPVYTSVLDYVTYTQVMTADIAVNIVNYTPTITGTVSCVDGNSININIINNTDQSVIANDTVTAENGTYNISYALPSLLSAKDYTVTINCMEQEKILASMSVEIDSSVLLISVTGTVETAEDVIVDANVSGGGLIEKSTSFTGNESVSATIPNIAANATINMTAVCRREVQAFEEPEVSAATYLVNGIAGEIFVIPASVYNFPVFESKTFKLTYNPDELTVINPKRQGENVLLGIDIISQESGTIVFSCTPGISGEGTISGVLNLFELQFNEAFSGTSELSLEVM